MTEIAHDTEYHKHLLSCVSGKDLDKWKRMAVRCFTPRYSRNGELRPNSYATRCERGGDSVTDEERELIIRHIHHVVQPFLYNKATIIRRNKKLGPRRSRRKDEY